MTFSPFLNFLGVAFLSYFFRIILLRNTLAVELVDKDGNSCSKVNIISFEMFLMLWGIGILLPYIYTGDIILGTIIALILFLTSVHIVKKHILGIFLVDRHTKKPCSGLTHYFYITGIPICGNLVLTSLILLLLSG